MLKMDAIYILLTPLTGYVINIYIFRLRDIYINALALEVEG